MISSNEYRERISRAQKRITENGLDAFMVSSEESIYYLTGASYTPLERPFFILIFPTGEPRLIVPAMEKKHLEREAGIPSVSSYREYPSPPGQGWPESLQKGLGNSRRVGCEPSLSREISDVLTDRELKTVPCIDELRFIKSDAEISMIRRSAEYCSEASARLFRSAYYGISELEIYSQQKVPLVQAIRGGNFDPVNSSFLVMSWVAPDTVDPHSIPKAEDRLKDGPHISITQMRINGYAAEHERTWFLSAPTVEERDHFAVMMEARKTVLPMMHPGTPCSEIDAAANRYFTDRGYGDNVLHRSGHGIGLGVHEGPWVAEGSPHRLKENMVVSVEPGIYVPGAGGFRHSDTVLITSDGPELLTRGPVDIDSLVFKKFRPVTRVKGGIMRRFTGIQKQQA